MANTATSIYLAGDDALDLTANPDYNFQKNDFTIEMWIDPVSVAGGGARLFCRADQDKSGIMLQVTDAKTVNLYHSNNGTSWTVTSANTGVQLVTGKWTHLAVSSIGGLISFFGDGHLSNTYTHVSKTTSSCSPPRIGQNNGGTEDLECYLDEIRISKVARYGNIDRPTTFVSSTQTAGRGKNALRPEHVSLLIQSNSTVTTSDKILDRTGKNTVTISGCAYTQNFTQFGNCSIYFDVL